MTKKQDRAISLISDGIHLLNWTIAIPKGARVQGMVIGTARYVDKVTAAVDREAAAKPKKRRRP